MVVETRVTRLLNIELPIIQAGMVWTSGWRLAAAVSNAGGLGVIGAGSMYPPVLEEHILKCKDATIKPFAVNVPLLYPGIEEIIQIIIKTQVPIVITSAGNPAAWTGVLKEKGITVMHVVGSTRFARKAEAAGCDAIIAEGFEAGGHNSREETTTLVLIPAVAAAVNLPVIAAGGIATGRQMLAAMVLGAEAVQMGSRFVVSAEASCHDNFKHAVAAAGEGDTQLMMKKLTPVRLLRNQFFQEVEAAESRGASSEELKTLLGRARAKRGMFEGKLDEGELEIGQVASLLSDISPAAQIIDTVYQEFAEALQNPLKMM